MTKYPVGFVQDTGARTPAQNNLPSELAIYRTDGGTYFLKIEGNNHQKSLIELMRSIRVASSNDKQLQRMMDSEEYEFSFNGHIFSSKATLENIYRDNPENFKNVQIKLKAVTIARDKLNKLQESESMPVWDVNDKDELYVTIDSMDLESTKETFSKMLHLLPSYLEFTTENKQQMLVIRDRAFIRDVEHFGEAVAHSNHSPTSDCSFADLSHEIITKIGTELLNPKDYKYGTMFDDVVNKYKNIYLNRPPSQAPVQQAPAQQAPAQ